MTYFIHRAAYVDVLSGTTEVQDVLVRDGMVEAMGPTLVCPEDAQVIQAEGMYLTAGWIDSHVHLANGVSADAMLRQGVTWVQEAGSTGPVNFAQFYETVIKPSKINIRSYLYLAPWGIEPEHELQDLSLVDLDAWEQVYRQYAQVIRGVKLRIDPRVCYEPLKALAMAREAADRVGVPVVVHASRCGESMEDILSMLQAGDIFAHIYAKKLPGLLDESGRVKACVWDAQRRGVKFELAHGNGNFSYAVAREAFRQGFFCDAISTDIHERSLGNVKSLAMTMGKAMACGMELMAVLRKVTAEPAAMLGLQEKQITVQPGKPADLVLFRVEDMPLTLPDSDGEPMVCPRQFVPCLTMLGRACYPAEQSESLT